eukprot:2874359-Rhodomonas_salina.3
MSRGELTWDAIHSASSGGRRESSASLSTEGPRSEERSDHPTVLRRRPQRNAAEGLTGQTRVKSIPARMRAWRTALPQARRASSKRVRDWLVRRVRRSARAELTRVRGAMVMVSLIPNAGSARHTNAAQAVKVATTGTITRAVLERCQVMMCLTYLQVEM